MKHLVLLALLGFAACGPRLPTYRGNSLAIVTERQREESCRVIGIATGSSSWGFDASEHMRGAMNEARTKAANMGANAIRIIQAQSLSSEYGPVTANVTAEALHCEFEKKPAPGPAPSQVEI